MQSSSSVRHVRPKKSLGQHFLHDKGIARKIVEALQADAGTDVLEIGPGTGVLTDMLLQRSYHRLKVVEIDRDSVAYLREHYPSLEVLEGDFLEIIRTEAEALNKKMKREVCVICGFVLDVKEILGQSDLVIGVGRVALEAMACGVPVLSMNRQRMGSIISTANYSAYKLTNFVAP
ncbi:MAG: glycosyltransferase, partial [Cyclobacteriaceae bacterium]|nr:glycosyltransferase [Cyclobacteriaceae bacterium]